MPRVRYTLEQRVFMYDAYVKSGSARKVRRRFRRKFQDVSVPHRETVHRIVNKVRATGSLLDRKPELKRRVLTEEKLDEIGARLEHSPRKSLRCLAQETGVSITTVRTATKLLKQPTFEKVVMLVECAGNVLRFTVKNIRMPYHDLRYRDSNIHSIRIYRRIFETIRQNLL